MKLSTDFKVNW